MEGLEQSEGSEIAAMEDLNSWWCSERRLTQYRASVCILLYATTLFFLFSNDYNLWYFTVQNYTLLIVVFTLLLICSLVNVWQGVKHFTATFAQVALVNAVFLDTVYWILVFTTRAFTSGFEHALFTVVLHFCNCLLISIEFLLNNLQLRFIALGVGISYVVVYTFVVALIFYKINGEWPYTFLGFHNGSVWHVLLVYMGLFALYTYVVTFFILKLMLTFKLKYTRIYTLRKEFSQDMDDIEHAGHEPAPEQDNGLPTGIVL